MKLSGSEIGRAMLADMGISFKSSAEPIDVTDKLNKKVLEISGYSCVHKTGFGYCDFCPLAELETCELSKNYSK